MNYKWLGGLHLRALIFENNKKPYFPESLRHFLRVPQVLRNIHEVQEIWDQHFESEFNLINRITLEGHLILSNENLRSLLLGVVQIGFFERYLKSNPYPQWIAGQSKNFSPLLCCANQISFKDMVTQFLKRTDFWKLSTSSLSWEEQSQIYDRDEFCIFKLCQKADGPSYEKIVETDSKGVFKELLIKEGVMSVVWTGSSSAIEQMEKEYKGVDFKDIVDLEPEFAKVYWKDLQEVLVKKEQELSQ